MSTKKNNPETETEEMVTPETEEMTIAEDKTPSKGKSKAKTEKMVKIKIDLTRTERDDVYVALNGKTYLIKRGVEVEVPEGVAEILDHSEEMLTQAMEFEAQAAANADF